MSEERCLFVESSLKTGRRRQQPSQRRCSKRSAAAAARTHQPCRAALGAAQVPLALQSSSYSWTPPTGIVLVNSSDDEQLGRVQRAARIWGRRDGCDLPELVSGCPACFLSEGGGLPWGSEKHRYVRKGFFPCFWDAKRSAVKGRG